MPHWVLFIQRTCFYFAWLAAVVPATMGVRIYPIHTVNILSSNGAASLKHQAADICDKLIIPPQNTNKSIDFISEMCMSVEQSTESFKAAQQLIFRQTLNKFPVPFSSREPITMCKTARSGLSSESYASSSYLDTLSLSRSYLHTLSFFSSYFHTLS
jgi:hypothetical protein